MRFAWSVFLFVSCSLSAHDFSEFPRTPAVVDILVNEHGFARSQVDDWMARGAYQEAPSRNLSAPAETTKSYAQYKPMFLSKNTIRKGRVFRAKHQQLLVKAEADYGIPVSIIVAIIGIESRYGQSTGRHGTFDSLGSLAVTEGRRADYFQREWIQFLVIARQQGLDPLKIKGSYAGATGYPQFMPTSYDAYAVDHDGDGDIDIWNDPYDAIGSVANYLKENGWRRGAIIVSKASVKDPSAAVKVNSFDRNRTLMEVEKLGWYSAIRQPDDAQVFPIRLDGEAGTEYWLGYRNFWVISRYNHAIAYSMAVFQLAEAIEQ
ncbi:lytic murein transglycosylase B [Reinekea sp.]|jgi:membrane-bound lytic murein transglycosylase B|uniref:lytic murein transglycosylase B n=1 Tax=Reinekea sp. TaxID=1970455 RepID=UPI002A7F563D|nr:lytic murein transglycosylase B [Reinekea sp.]